MYRLFRIFSILFLYFIKLASRGTISTKPRTWSPSPSERKSRLFIFAYTLRVQFDVSAQNPYYIKRCLTIPLRILIKLVIFRRRELEKVVHRPMRRMDPCSPSSSRSSSQLLLQIRSDCDSVFEKDWFKNPYKVCSHRMFYLDI